MVWCRCGEHICDFLTSFVSFYSSVDFIFVCVDLNWIFFFTVSTTKSPLLLWFSFAVYFVELFLESFENGFTPLRIYCNETNIRNDLFKWKNNRKSKLFRRRRNRRRKKRLHFAGGSTSYQFQSDFTLICICILSKLIHTTRTNEHNTTKKELIWKMRDSSDFYTLFLIYLSKCIHTSNIVRSPYRTYARCGILFTHVHCAFDSLRI